MVDVLPVVPTLAAIYTTSGVTASLSSEPMQEIDMTSQGYPRYTVYEVVAPGKRYLVRGVTPVFQADFGGDSNFVTITGIVEYAGGRIRLSAPRGSADVVRCYSGSYYTTITKVFGASVSKLNNGPSLVEVPLLGDAYVRRYPTIRDFDVSVDSFMVCTEAEVTTTADAPNGHLTFQHALGGTAGNSITVEIVNPGSSSPLNVSVSGNEISVVLAYDTAVTSTAYDVLRAVNVSPECKALGVLARMPAGSTGLGLMADSGAALPLVGGLDAADFDALFGVPLIIIMYVDTVSDTRLEGYAYLESDAFTFDPTNVVTETLSFKGDGLLYYRAS